MESEKLEKELIARETAYWEALKKKDVTAARAFTDDPCFITGASGVGNISGEKFAELLKGSKWTIENYRFDDMQVRMLGEDVAIVAYKVHEDLTVDGRPVSFDAADSSTWVRRKGGWVCALHTEALSGDPFGRDRAANQNV
jgi:hypothetical protein